MPLTEPQLHQLRTVQRMADGDHIALFNGRDGEWLARLRLAKKSGTAELLHQTRPQVPLTGPWLLFAPIKQGRIDFLVEKAAELGAERLIPVTTHRTQAQRIGHERLQHAVREAAEQCERLNVPVVDDLTPLAKALELLGERHLYVCAETGETVPVEVAFSLPLPAGEGRGEGLMRQPETAPHPPSLRSVRPLPLGEVRKAAFLTGPEGGFDPAELAQLTARPGTTMIGLGPRILRAETAALAVLACWQAIAGDWDTRETPW